MATTRKTFADGSILTATDVNSALNPYEADHIPFGVDAGITTGITLSGTTQQLSVSFASGRFTKPPAVTMTPLYSSYAGDLLQVHIYNVSTTTLTYRVSMANGGNLPTNTTFSLSWIAVQMSK